MGEVMIGGCLGRSSHKGFEFKIFGDMRKSVSRTNTLDFRRADFKLLKELVLWESAFKAAEVHTCWSLFKGTGEGNSNVSAVNQAGQKIGLTKQGSPAET